MNHHPMYMNVNNSNSLLCEWRRVCKKSDPKSAPLLSATDDDIINYNTMENDDDELKTPPSSKESPS